MTAPTYHVTRIIGPDIHGHNTHGCDPSGCAGDELFIIHDENHDVTVGDVVDEDGRKVEAEPTR